MIRVIIGTETNQLLPERVLEYSIRKFTKTDVDIRPVHQTEHRVGGTNFGFVRFHVPQMCGYSGKAIYLDADQLVFDDIQKLYDQLEGDHAIALVNSPEGTFGGKPVGQHNQTSVMVLDCEKLSDWKPDVMFKDVVPNRQEKQGDQIHYRDFMMLSWFDRNKIKPLPPTWNHFNVIRENTKLVHFSHVRSQPWTHPDTHSLSEVWGKWLREAIREKFVSRWLVVKEVLRGHVHPHFLKYCVG
jgi:lipopolysaccharide biosynthesis glycosyltransferase